jgi:hypothetical protein
VQPTVARRVAKVAVPLAASVALGPIAGLLTKGIMGLATGGPFAQRVGKAIAYPGAVTTPAGSQSPYTPMGWNAPNFSPTSGGSLNSYTFNPNTGQGAYINSAGRTINYSVAPSYGGNFGFPGNGTF